MASPAAYSNYSNYSNPASAPARGNRPSSVQLKVAAQAERDRELKLKHSIDQANRILDRLEARAEAQSQQIARWQGRKALTLARKERLEDRILTEMQNAGLDKLTGLQTTLSARPAGVLSLVVDDQSLIPDQYMRQPPIPPKAPDKLAIKTVLSRGYAPEATDQEIAEARAIQGVHLAQAVSLVRK